MEIGAKCCSHRSALAMPGFDQFNMASIRRRSSHPPTCSDRGLCHTAEPIEHTARNCTNSDGTAISELLADAVDRRSQASPHAGALRGGPSLRSPMLFGQAYSLGCTAASPSTLEFCSVLRS